jgi:hypothetical protein
MGAKKSIDELVAELEKKTAALKLKQANERLDEAGQARKQLEESRKQLEAERHDLRRKIAVGGMLLSWVPDATENMSLEELKSKLEGYLAVDVEVIDVTHFAQELNSIIAEE